MHRRTLPFLLVAAAATTLATPPATPPDVRVVAAGAAPIRPVPVDLDLHGPEIDAAVAAHRDDLAARRDDTRSQRTAEEPVEVAGAPPVPSGSVWDRLAACESGGDWASSTGTYEGGLQFHPSTWDAAKPAGYPDAAHRATREQQVAVAERVLAEQGWSAWPACSGQLGLS